MSNSALEVQLETLQTRIVVHGNRVWQLPFTYVGFASVAASLAIQENGPIPAHIFFFALSAVGVLVLWAIIDAWLSYRRTGLDMNKLEALLKIPQFTSASFFHGLPHIAICIATIVTLAAAGLYLKP